MEKQTFLKPKKQFYTELPGDTKLPSASVPPVAKVRYNGSHETVLTQIGAPNSPALPAGGSHPALI